MKVLSSQQKRQKRGIIAMAVMLIAFFIIFYLNSNKTEDVIFAFILGDEWKLINEWKIDSRTGALIFLVLTLIGVLTSLRGFNRGKGINLGV
jgi:predicted nucleic acid-binding Zn ribbon protein